MGVIIDRVRFAANTSAGNQTVTFSLGGLTPKAVLFVWGLPTADNTASDGLVAGMGAADGSVQAAVVHTEQHAQASSNSAVAYNGTQCIRLVNDAATVLQTAAYSSFGANQVTITWTVTTGTAVLIDAIAFAGSDLSVDVTDTTLTNTLGATDDITAPGFEPDDVIAFCQGAIGISFGFIHNDRAGGVTQRAVISAERTSRPTMEDTAKISESHGCFCGSTAATDQLSWLSFGTFDSSGFSVTNANTAPGAAKHLITLALRYGTSPVISSKVYTYSTPVVTGDSTDTNPGFTPQAIFYVPTLLEAVNSYDTSTLAGSWGFSTIVASGQNSLSWSSEDAAADSNTQTLNDNQAVNLPLHTGAAGMVATFSTFTTSGVTLNWTDVETNAKKWAAIAFQQFVAGTNYTKTLTATVNIADTILEAIGRYKTITNTTNIADTITNLRNISRTFSSTVNVSDVISRAIDKVKSISNTVNISDTISAAKLLLKTLTSSVNVSDTLTNTRELFRTFSNSIQVSDTLTNVREILKTLSNEIQVSDTLTNLRNIFKTITNTTEISDTLSRAIDKLKTIANSINVSDTISTSKGIFKTLTNTINVSDTIESVKILIRTITNSVQVSDTVSNIRNISKNIANAINISDVISNIRNISKTVSNSINVSDTISTARELFKTITNAINISDIINAVKLGAEKFVTLTSSIQISDTILNVRSLVKSITNSISITDTISQAREISKTLLESINVSDVFSTARDLIRTISNSLQVSSIITTARSLFVTLTSNINISDLLEILKLKLVLIANSINISDTISTVVEQFINVAREKFRVYLTGSKDLISRLSGSFKRRKTLSGSKDKDEHFTG